jgi:predicted ATP-binding protein involved in virulence
MRYASELAEMIRSKLAESAALSQSLDRTFPARLVQHGLNKRIADEDIQKRLAALEEKRSRLKATGLLEKDEDMNFQIGTTLDDHTKGVLAVYAEDVEKKLSVFDDIVGRLDLLKTFISGRFLYKRMAISKDNGFVFTTLNGTPLTPADLSSGEQHELVLLYELLFRVRPGSLILIDEPEISLHIAWQEVFLRDLLSITSLSHFDVLIATHSPQIIHDRLDLTVRLKGPDNTTETVQGMPGHSK